MLNNCFFNGFSDSISQFCLLLVVAFMLILKYIQISVLLNAVTNGGAIYAKYIFTFKLTHMPEHINSRILLISWPIHDDLSSDLFLHLFILHNIWLKFWMNWIFKSRFCFNSQVILVYSPQPFLTHGRLFWNTFISEYPQLNGCQYSISL
jgi:hypothetical protein